MTVAFGYGFGSKSIVCVIISFFPIPTNLLLGMKSVDPGMHDLFTLHGASWYVRIRKLALPAAIPHLFTAFRISAGLSVIGAIVGEQFFQQGRPGLGQRLIEYRVLLEYERLYATLLVSSLLGISVYLSFTFIGNRLTRNWYGSRA
jgi:NitT/TauT family transport system permease protein